MEPLSNLNILFSLQLINKEDSIKETILKPIPLIDIFSIPSSTQSLYGEYFKIPSLSRRF